MRIVKLLITCHRVPVALVTLVIRLGIATSNRPNVRFKLTLITVLRKSRNGIILVKALFMFSAVVAEPSDPCNPSPCGPNSQCRNRDGQAVCSCLPTYVGAPPGCRPECVVSSECAPNRACVNQKCVDPCPGTCGQNARCEVINHSPICSCRQRYTGDPFSRCSPIPRKHSFLYSCLSANQ